MIVVSGTIDVEAANEAAAMDAAREVAAETRREPGCQSYAFYRDIETPGRFRVFEEWDDTDALKRHFETPHMARFRDKLAGLGLKNRDVTRYDVSGSAKL